MAIRLQTFWDDEATRPGVKKVDLDAWDTRTGCSLPKLLRKLYALHDGGPVRYAPFLLYPLEELVVTTADFWSAVEYSKKLVPVKSLVFALGEDIDHGDHLYFLNFNTKGPTGEPSVCHLWHDPAALSLAAKSVKVFLDQEVGVTDAPVVDWSAAEGLDTILHREVIEMLCLREEVIFGRSGAEFVWYNRRTIGDDITYHLVKLPVPLNKGWATIQRYRPGRTWSLMLQPVNQAGIVSIESKCRSDGRWKNEIDHGVPGHVMLESADRDVLTRLQSMLFALVFLISAVVSCPAVAIELFHEHWKDHYLTGNSDELFVKRAQSAGCYICHVKGQNKREVQNDYGKALGRYLDAKDFPKDWVDANPEEAKRKIIEAFQKVEEELGSI